MGWIEKVLTEAGEDFDTWLEREQIPEWAFLQVAELGRITRAELHEDEGTSSSDISAAVAATAFQLGWGAAKTAGPLWEIDG